MFRNILFQVHLWTGLILGLVLTLIGISGSLLVYQKELIQLGQKPLPRAEAQGTPLSADALLAAGKAAVPGKTDSVTLVLPSAPGEAAAVFMRKVAGHSGEDAGTRGEHRHARGEGHGDQMRGEGHGDQMRGDGHGDQMRGEGRGDHMRGEGRRDGGGPGWEGGRRNYTYVYLDPVSGKVLDVRDTQLNPFMAFMHQFHGNLMLGRDGRQVVGWFGVVMLLLGLSGIYLWWPKRGTWKYAFGIRKNARGYLFHRDLHGAVGIWLWVVFVVVSFTGVAIAFPNTAKTALSTEQSASFDPRRGPVVEPIDGVDPIGIDAASALVKAQVPGAQFATIALPNKPEETIRLTLAGEGTAAVAFVDPYAKKIVAWRNKPADFLSWQRPLHEGHGLGPVWRALVCISGLLPLLFTITGLVMWLKKRKGKAGSRLRAV